VAPGQPLGEVLGEQGDVRETLAADRAGVVVLARRTARVRPGDGAYLIAAVEEDETAAGVPGQAPLPGGA
jgi:hypothetical protein